jgi:hypothetical protein
MMLIWTRTKLPTISFHRPASAVSIKEGGLKIRAL